MPLLLLDPRRMGSESEAPETVAEMLVIVPSRGRPENIARLVEAWAKTGANAHLRVVVDDDDETIGVHRRPPADYIVDPLSDEPVPLIPQMGYRQVLDLAPPEIDLVVGQRQRLGPTLNREAVPAAEQYKYLGFMGDDHCPQTEHWDAKLIEAIERMGGTGIAYGNDLMQCENLPTAVFMSSDIVRTLGYMTPPELVHLFLDNTWKTWGEKIGRLAYLPDTIIEHLHPQAGKGHWDENYTFVNSPFMWEHDEKAWNEYVEAQLDADVEKLRALL